MAVRIDCAYERERTEPLYVVMICCMLVGVRRGRLIETVVFYSLLLTYNSI